MSFSTFWLQRYKSRSSSTEVRLIWYPFFCVCVSILVGEPCPKKETGKSWHLAAGGQAENPIIWKGPENPLPTRPPRHGSRAKWAPSAGTRTSAAAASPSYVGASRSLQTAGDRRLEKLTLRVSEPKTWGFRFKLGDFHSLCALQALFVPGRARHGGHKPGAKRNPLGHS